MSYIALNESQSLMKTEESNQAQQSEQSETFNSSRRNWLATVGMLPIATGLINGPAKDLPLKSAGSLPVKDKFQINGTYLNAAYTHPMSLGSVKAIHSFLDLRMVNGNKTGANMATDRTESRNLFAKLINASPEELAWIPSTMVGENLIVSGLGLHGSKSRVVTDAYHFDGSLYLYQQLAKQGLDLHILRPRNNQIDLNEMDAAVKPGTKLVAISLVSTINGFQHDLKAVCDLAHSRGAMVYADIIQAAGAVPIDVRASGVDFCACSTYKWLMGDFGVGFLYVRKDRLELLKRSQFGYRQLADYAFHTFPFDPPGKEPFESRAREDVAGHFEVGTLGYESVAALRYSLNLLLETGVEKIQQYRQPMMDRLQAELPGLGYAAMTPVGSTSPIVSFAFKDAARILQPRLDAAGINIQLYENRLRISPSIYNDMADIEKLIKTLS